MNCPPDHKHGETGTCHTSHRCRCDDCRTGHTRREMHRRRQVAYGRRVEAKRPRVDREPARAHVERLVGEGMTLSGVAVAAGVSLPTVKHLRAGKQAFLSKPISDALLAVRPCPAGGGFVPARGVVRRFQALACLGWSMRAQAVEAGLDPAQYGLAVRGDRERVSRDTHDRVAAMYDRLSMRPRTGRSKAEKAAVTRIKTVAAGNGWAPPLSWTDIDMDEAPVGLIDAATAA